MNITRLEKLLCSPTYPVGCVFETVLEFVEVATGVIRENFDTSKGVNLICTGSSGAIISALVAAKLSEPQYLVPDVKIVYYDKVGEKSHMTNRPYITEGIFLIVDDNISSGDTVTRLYFNHEEHITFNNSVYPIKTKFKIDGVIVGGNIESNARWKLQALTGIKELYCADAD